MKSSKNSTLPLVITLAIASASASAADWIPIGSSGGEPFFIEKSNIRKNGSVLNVWILKNLSAQNSLGARSHITAYLLNCQAWEIAMRAGVDYSELDGKGEVRYSLSLKSDQINYTPAVPGTVKDAILHAGCENQ